MIDMGQIQAAITGLGAAKEVVKVAFDAKVDQSASAKVVEAMSRLGEATDTLYKLRDELFRLQQENTELKAAAVDREAFNLEKAKYELSKTPGGAIVWHYKEQPEHYACPSCMNAKRIEILQDNRTSRGKFRCVAAGCGAEYPINVQQKPDYESAIANAGPPRGPAGWMR